MNRPFALTSILLFAALAFAQPPKSETPPPEKSTAPTAKRALIVLTSHSKLGDTGRATGFYLSEASHAWDVFKNAGFVVEFASPEGGKAPIEGVKMDDPVNAAFMGDADVKSKLATTRRVDQVQPSEFAILYFAGGHGTMWDFPDNTTLAALTANMYERGKVVAAVCHGPAALVNVKLADGTYLVKGKTVSAFTNEEEKNVKLEAVVPFLLEDKLVERGASFRKSAPFEKHVEIDGRLITGQNPASAKGVAEAAVRSAEQSAK